MVLEIAGGLVVLLLAGDLLVRGAVTLAQRTDIPPAVVGLTIVAFGTSAPELFVSVGAAWRGHAELAVGNVVGSNIANVLLVLGVPALIRPTGATRDPVGVDTVWMLVVSALFVALCFLGPLGVREGVLMITLLAALMAQSLRRALRGNGTAAEGELARLGHLPRRRMIGLYLLLGLCGLPLGARLVVSGATELAIALGVTDGVIGLSVVAFGTSLPELATTAVAALRGHADVAIGNVLGSNLFNILAIMGAATFAAGAPIPVPAAFLHFDLWVMLAAALALGALALRGGAVSRGVATLFVALYVAYMAVLFSTSPLRVDVLI